MDDKAKMVRKKRLAKISDYQQTFSTPHGKRVLFDLMSKFNFHLPVYEDSPHLMAFNNGQRSAILIILKEMKTDIAALEKAMEDAHEHDRRNLGPDGWS